jgi:hypothetical protein
MQHRERSTRHRLARRWQPSHRGHRPCWPSPSTARQTAGGQPRRTAPMDRPAALQGPRHPPLPPRISGLPNPTPSPPTGTSREAQKCSTAARPTARNRIATGAPRHDMEPANEAWNQVMADRTTRRSSTSPRSRGRAPGSAAPPTDESSRSPSPGCVRFDERPGTRRLTRVRLGSEGIPAPASEDWRGAVSPRHCSVSVPASVPNSPDLKEAIPEPQPGSTLLIPRGITTRCMRTKPAKGAANSEPRLRGWPPLRSG